MNVVRETNRWYGVSGVALLAGGVGIVAGSPVVLLTGVVGVAFAAYALTATAPEIDVDVERTVSDPEPLPGDEVSVTVTVTNVGDASLPDLRIVDGVPEALGVTDGSARLGTALLPGKEARFSYTVEAERGEHRFDPALVLARDFSGAVERETTVDVETTIDCTPTLMTTVDVPLRAQTTQYTGRVTTDIGGTGVEFYSTREYRPGDPLSRIDWNRRARTGELTTVEFREERAATVVLIVDGREDAYRTGEDDEANAVQHSVDAAGKVVTALLETGDRVGITGLAPDSCWLDPGTGQDHRVRVRELLAGDPAFSHTPSDRPFYPSIRMNWLRKRLPARAQVILFSPLCDDYIGHVARRLNAGGHPVTVVSPDPTSAGTSGQRLASAERAGRVHTLRKAGLRVLDWDPAESFDAVLARVNRRWSA